VPCWTRTADRPGRVVRSRDVRQRQSSSKSLSTYISNPNPACRFNSKKRFQKTALHTLPAVAPRIICSCCTYVWLTLGDSVYILFEKHVRRVRLLWEFSILLLVESGSTSPYNMHPWKLRIHRTCISNHVRGRGPAGLRHLDSIDPMVETYGRRINDSE